MIYGVGFAGKIPAAGFPEMLVLRFCFYNPLISKDIRCKHAVRSHSIVV